MGSDIQFGVVELFKAEDGLALQVKLENDSVWLNHEQLSNLFSTDRTSILKHIKKIYTSGELDEIATCAKIAQVRKEGKRQVKRDINYFNLDVILSVGYKVNSIKATKFRIWANKVLKEYLVQGYAINEGLLKEQTRRLEQLQQTVKLLSNVLHNKALTTDEATGLLQVITDFSYALQVLDDYDHQTLRISHTHSTEVYTIGYDEAIEAIDQLKTQTGGSELFGREKDESFRSSINTIYQSFNGVELYPSVEEKAAHLLYFIVKNHSFIDGNKRIAAFLFIWFMERNKILYNVDKKKRLADNALVALTLMIAESKPEEKEMMINVVVNLINAKNG